MDLGFLFLKSDKNYQIRRFEPNKNTFHNFNLLSFHKGVEFLQQISVQKGNQKRGERGLHIATQYRDIC